MKWKRTGELAVVVGWGERKDRQHKHTMPSQAAFLTWLRGRGVFALLASLHSFSPSRSVCVSLRLRLCLCLCLCLCMYVCARA